MIRSLLKLGLLLVVGVLIYNYFLGTPEEKETSKKIFREVRDLGQATWSLLRSERQKFDEGKYDEAVDKVGNLYDRLRGHARQAQDADLLNRIEDLEQKRESLKLRLDSAQDSGNSLSSGERSDLRREWSDLMQQTEELMQEMEGN